MFAKTIIMLIEAFVEMIAVMMIARASVVAGQPLIGNMLLFFGALIIGGNFFIRFLLLSEKEN